MRGMSYTELATTVIAPFVEGSIDRETLAGLVDASYRDFRHQAVAPVLQLITTNGSWSYFTARRWPLRISPSNCWGGCSITC